MHVEELCECLEVDKDTLKGLVRKFADPENKPAYDAFLKRVNMTHAGGRDVTDDGEEFVDPDPLKVLMVVDFSDYKAGQEYTLKYSDAVSLVNNKMATFVKEE